MQCNWPFTGEVSRTLSNAFHICTYKHTYIHTYMHAYICSAIGLLWGRFRELCQRPFTYVRINIHTYIHTCMHTYAVQLAFYGGGFENFGKLRPDVVEALPTVTESGATALITFRKYLYTAFFVCLSVCVCLSVLFGEVSGVLISIRKLFDTADSSVCLSVCLCIFVFSVNIPCMGAGIVQVTCERILVHAYIHTDVHTRIHTYVQMRVHTYVHTYILGT